MNPTDARDLFRTAYRRCAADTDLIPIVLLVKDNTVVCISPLDLPDAANILAQAAASFQNPDLHAPGQTELH